MLSLIKELAKVVLYALLIAGLALAIVIIALTAITLGDIIVHLFHL